MTTVNAGAPPAPPMPYFDDDDMLDDYIDDDDFGGPPPPPPAAPTTTNVSAPQTAPDEFGDDEDYWEAMMEFEGQRQQQQQKESTTATATIASPTAVNDSTLDPTNQTQDLALGDDEAPHESEGESDLNTNTQNTNTVEEYLAARRQDNNLYNFERYKKNKGWRTLASSSQQQQQQQSRHRNRALASLSKTAGSFAKTVAPEARFLRLLEANRSDKFYTKGGSNLKLEQRSSKGVNVFRSPPKEDSVLTVPLTLADGSRVYVRSSRKNDSSDSKSSDASTVGRESSKSCALGVSMKELFRRVDTMRRRKIANARRNATLSTDESTTNSNGGDDRLWVDKHAPKSFPDLLSEERTNREVLRALRGWDPYVFRKAPPLRPLYQRQREQEQQEKQEASGKKNKNEEVKKDTNDKRPEENARVILLSGPPGVGKTTLAHIVARHAGYRPVEVNASDERSSGVLKDRIQRAMESTTINFKPDGSNENSKKNSATPKDDFGRPNCLILDEIDGADARGSIQALVDIVKAEIPSASSKKNQQTKSSETYLRRPIICICNHKYAPALRPLLPYAAHFNVEPPSSARLVARLKAILNAEKMSMMGGGPLLNQLVVASGGDIRSCLFTLQFAAAESKDAKELSEALTQSLSGTGLKDNRNDISSTISAVFRKTKTNIGQFASRLSGSSSTEKDRASVSRVMNAVEGLGDHTAAMNAMFMNVLRVSYIDPAFDRCSAAHELLSFAANTQNEQSGYAVPVVTAGIHLLCRVEVKPDLTFSTRELADIKYRRESNSGLVQKFCEGLPAKAKNLKCNYLLAEEFIPLALWVLSAGDGSVSLSRAASSIDILTNKEQDAAKKHVEALCGLGLTYVVDREQQEKEGAGASYRTGVNEMRMEPPIHRLVEYNSVRHPGGLRRKDIPSQMKELLAHQVLLESFRSRSTHSSETPSKNDDDATEKPVLEKAKLEKDAKPLISPAKMTPRKLGQVATTKYSPGAKGSKSTPSPNAGNFLGIAARKGKAAKSARRAAALGLNRLSSKKQKLAHSGSGFLLSNVVRMKYVKGFTQAVRTPCRLNDLE